MAEDSTIVQFGSWMVRLDALCQIWSFLAPVMQLGKVWECPDLFRELCSPPWTDFGNFARVEADTKHARKSVPDELQSFPDAGQKRSDPDLNGWGLEGSAIAMTCITGPASEVGGRGGPSRRRRLQSWAASCPSSAARFVRRGAGPP